MPSRSSPGSAIAAVAPAPHRPSLWAVLLHRLAVARSRRDLAGLDDRLLEDIGLTRALAEEEARRGYFDGDPG